MRERRLKRFAALALAALSAGAAWAAEPQPQEKPLEVGLEEQVEVRLVLIDVVVLDRDGRTVPDLTASDFVVVVGGREIEIATFDRDCAAGAVDDPLPGERSTPLPPLPTSRPRQIVLAFDYDHMEAPFFEVFDQAQQMLDKWPAGGEEHMVVVLGNGVRILTPFTSDLDEVRRTLDRMQNDPGLYGGHYGQHLTERSFFDGVEVLFDLLERSPGRKSVVLFSGPFAEDGFYHDPEFKRVSALAAATRTAFYPVDTGGLRTPMDPNVQPSGGPPMLRRLANETGGRMTDGTNELGLAYARAHRDLSCTYTLGYHDPSPTADRRRRQTIRVRDRRGLRVVYPDYFVMRSPEEKRRSLFQSAQVTPEPFESKEVLTDLFLLAPRSKSRWRAVATVEFRPAPETWLEPGEPWELRGFLRKPNGTNVEPFRSSLVPATSDPANGAAPALAFHRELQVKPGRYVLSAVLSDPAGETPLAASRPLEVAKIPEGQPFLVGPVLGHAASETPQAPAFVPLVSARVAVGEPIDVYSAICLVESRAPVEVQALAHELVTANGEVRLAFEPASVTLGGKGAAPCHEVVDHLATGDLAPGEYELRISARTSTGVVGRGAVRFRLGAPEKQ